MISIIYQGLIFIRIAWLKVNSQSDWLSKRGYLAWNCTCAWKDIADVSGEQKLLLSWKKKLQLLLGKIHQGSERIYLKWMSAKFWIEFFWKIWANHSNSKYEETHWNWLWKGFHFHSLRTGAASKNRKRLVLLRCFRYAIQVLDSCDIGFSSEI